MPDPDIFNSEDRQKIIQNLKDMHEKGIQKQLKIGPLFGLDPKDPKNRQAILDWYPRLEILVYILITIFLFIIIWYNLN